MACAVPNQDRVIVTKFITSGAVPIIPSGSCAEEGTREIEEAEIVVNTRDKRVFTRAGNSIIELTNQGGGGGVGTVTSVSVITNQGVSGTVATATTTPAITLSLGALTGVTSLNGLVVTANTGVITTGTWQATAIADAYIASAATWNAKVSTGVITGSGLTMATSRILGRTTAGTGAIEEISIGSGLSLAAGTLSAIGSAVALSAITAAGTTNSIDNLDYAQTWAWSTADTESPFIWTANALTTGSLFSLTTSSASLNSTNGVFRVINSGASTSGILARFQSSSTSESGMTILANGHVGIGETAPDRFLEVVSTSNTNCGKFALTSTATDPNSGLQAQVLNLTNTSSTLNTFVRMAFQSGSYGVGTIGAQRIDASGRGNLIFQTNTSGAAYTTQLTLTEKGNLLLGQGITAAGTTAEGVFLIKNNVAPTASVADAIQIYSTDLSAGNTMLSLYTEGTVVGVGTPVADRTIAIRVNGTVYYLLCSTIP